MKSLHQIKHELSDIFDLIKNMDGELTEDVERELTISKAELQQKSKNYLSVIDYYKHEIERASEAVKIAQSFKKKKEKEIDVLKSRLIDAVNEFGKIEVDFQNISILKSKSVEIYDIEKLSSRYLIKKVSYQPDKTKIKQDIESGIDVKGAKLVENDNLQVR